MRGAKLPIPDQIYIKYDDDTWVMWKTVIKNTVKFANNPIVANLSNDSIPAQLFHEITIKIHLRINGYVIWSWTISICI